MKRRTFLQTISLGAGSPLINLPSLASPDDGVVATQYWQLNPLNPNLPPTGIDLAGVGKVGMKLVHQIFITNLLPSLSRFLFLNSPSGQASPQKIEFGQTRILVIISDLNLPQTRQHCVEVVEEARARGVRLFITLIPTSLPHLAAPLSPNLNLGRTIPLAANPHPIAHCLRGLTDTIAQQFTPISPPPIIGVDFSDIVTILAGTGPTTHGFGRSYGDVDTRGRLATQAALHHLNLQFLAPRNTNWMVSIQANQDTMKLRDISVVRKTISSRLLGDYSLISAPCNNSLPDGHLTVSILATESSG